MSPLLVSISRALALVAFVGLAANSPGQATNISISPAPAWIRLSEWTVPASQPESRGSESSRYLLYERQENPQQKESFTRVVRLMENQTGVQDSGSLTFDFDPIYQELLLHRVQILREGKVLERLDRSKLKIIQPEPDLEGHLFTGKQKAVLFVEDLRVGDALEYAYTIRGANPVLDGHFSTRFVVQSSVPVDRERMRVIWLSAKPLYLRQHLTKAIPKQESWNGGTEYVWDFADLDGIPYEDSLPAGFEPYPYIEFSDFDDWSRVVEWALPLYSTGASNLPPELGALISKWQGAATNEERVRMALEFVQDELRYTGIELGPDSYRPAHPFETFRLRYGDCKGKAHLLCALLRELKIEAYPALVNTSAREAVARRLPSPFAFNHVIVKALIDGKTVWVDPTLSHQGGLLWDRYLPRFGKALVVKKGGTALADIPPSSAKALQRVTSTFRIKDYHSAVSLTVNTTYHGSEADDMREYFARADAKEVAKDYLNFYARYYPGVHELRRFEFKDERSRNVLELTEHYQIRDLWKLNKSSQQYEAVFYAESLEKMLTNPRTRVRKMPLRIPYPSRREQETVVYMPDKWDISPSDQSIECEAFSFHNQRNASGSTVRFQYDCETKTTVVAPEKVADYLKKFDEMQDLLGDTLFRPDNSPISILARMNWLMVVLAGFASAAALAGGLWMWRSARVPDTALAPSPPTLLPDPHLQGLGGWLILVGFGLCASLVWRPVSLVQNWEGFFSTAAWQAVAIPGGEHYHPLYGPLLIFELLGITLLLGLNVLAVSLFFARRRVFPRIYIALLLSNAAFLLTDQIASTQIQYLAEASPHSSSARELSRAIVQAIIWCSYMLRSRRVKATFVR